MMQNVMHTILAKFFDMPESKIQIEEQTPVKKRRVPGPGDKPPAKPAPTTKTTKSPPVRKTTKEKTSASVSPEKKTTTRKKKA